MLGASDNAKGQFDMDEFFALVTPFIDPSIIAPYTLKDVEWARVTDWSDCAPWYRDYAAATVSLVSMTAESRVARASIGSHAMREFLGALIG